MIKIMSESTDRMLAVQATGTLTDADYTEIWIPALQTIIDEFEVVRFYYQERCTGTLATKLFL